MRAYVGSSFESDLRKRRAGPRAPYGVKASTPIGHASAVVAAIVGGMMHRVPRDISGKRQPSWTASKAPRLEAH